MLKRRRHLPRLSRRLNRKKGRRLEAPAFLFGLTRRSWCGFAAAGVRPAVIRAMEESTANLD